MKPEGREQAGCCTSPGNPSQGSAACVWSINSSKAEQCASLTWSLREGWAHTRLGSHSAQPLTLHSPVTGALGGILQSGQGTRGGRERSVMSSTIQKNLRTHSSCSWQNFKQYQTELKLGSHTFSLWSSLKHTSQQQQKVNFCSVYSALQAP